MGTLRCWSAGRACCWAGNDRSRVCRGHDPNDGAAAAVGRIRVRRGDQPVSGPGESIKVDRRSRFVSHVDSKPVNVAQRGGGDVEEYVGEVQLVLIKCSGCHQRRHLRSGSGFRKLRSVAWQSGPGGSGADDAIFHQESMGQGRAQWRVRIFDPKDGGRGAAAVKGHGGVSVERAFAIGLRLAAAQVALTNIFVQACHHALGLGQLRQIASRSRRGTQPDSCEAGASVGRARERAQWLRTKSELKGDSILRKHTVKVSSAEGDDRNHN